MRYVFTDLDGTLLTKEGLANSTVDVCLKYQEKGNRLILSSGRNLHSVELFCDLLRLKEFKGALILVNGALMYDFNDGEIVKLPGLPKKEAKRIVRIAYLLFFRIYIVSEQGRETFQVLYDRLFYFARWVIKHKPMPKLEKFKGYPEEVQKIELGPTVFFDFFTKIIRKILKEYEIVSVNKYWIEIMPKGYNKGTMVECYLNKYNIDPQDVYIFGDGENDLSMLKMTDHSYAPENASEYVKSQVKHVCKSNIEHGVDKIIQTIE